MVQQLLARRPVLPDVWCQFSKSLEPAEFARGDVVLQAGVRTDALHVVRDGKTKTTCTSVDGRELLLDFHGAGDVLAEPTLFDAGPSMTTTVAVTTVRTGRISVRDLHKWLALCPEITDHLLATLARRQRERHQLRMDIVQVDATVRLAKALLRLATPYGVIEDLTQEELGQYIGSRRDTVNKTLSEFAQRGWIAIERKTILLTNPAQLRLKCR